MKGLHYLLFLLALSCSIISRISFEEKGLMLENNLTEWDEIRLEGVITLTYEQYTFRKFFVIKKNNYSARIDIFDKGFWGLNVKPFFSAYIDSSLYYRLPGQSNMQVKPIENIKLLNTKALLKNKEIILKDHKLKKENTIIYFSQNYLINRIEEMKNDFVIFLDYDHLNKLSEIRIEIKNKEVANLEIDKLSKQINKIQNIK